MSCNLQETAISNAWYEVLSVLHMMAIVSLLQANIMLLPKTSADGIQSKVSEGWYYNLYPLKICIWTNRLQ